MNDGLAQLGAGPSAGTVMKMSEIYIYIYMGPSLLDGLTEWCSKVIWFILYIYKQFYKQIFKI